MRAHFMVHRGFTRFYVALLALTWSWVGLGFQVTPSWRHWPLRDKAFDIAELAVTFNLLWLKLEFVANLTRDRQRVPGATGRWDLVSLGFGRWRWRRDRSTFPRGS